MLTPQQAVAAASGGAGEEPNFPRARFTTTPAAGPALVRRRTPARAAVPPRPGARTARPSLGFLSPRIRVWGLLAGLGRSGAGGAFNGPRLGAAAPEGWALRRGDAASAPLGCCSFGVPVPPETALKAGGVRRFRPRRPRPGLSPALRDCCPLPAPALLALALGPGGFELVNGPMEREGKCFIIV